MQPCHLIIGRNSKIVKDLIPLLRQPTETISHSELHHVDMSKYQNIFIFSWPTDKYDDFLKKIFAIPARKIIFVSTTAVLSLQLRRQWSKYPQEKRRFEKIILSRGGRVMRLGVVDESHIAKHIGAFPFTRIELLANLIDNINNQGSDIIDAFEIYIGSASGWRKFISTFLHNVSLALPQILAMQIALQGMAKLLGLKHYGYTADANHFFIDRLQIGYGCLGRNGPRLRKYNDLLITSSYPDELLNERGFCNTRIGRSKTGLSKYWHGVDLKTSSHTDRWRKHVPLILSRRGPPKRVHVSLHVNSLALPNNSSPWVLIGRDELHREKRYWCRKLILAAGALQNTRLLQTIFPLPVNLSDHEIGMIGTVPLTAACGAGLATRRGLMMQAGDVRSLSTACGIKFIVEARPNVPSKHTQQKSEDLSFYLDSNLGILKKLITLGDLRRLNEAFYNKIGCAFATDTCSIFVQALVPDAIYVPTSESKSKISDLCRTRLTSSQWQAIQNKVSDCIDDFKSDAIVRSVDAQHMHGASAMLSVPAVQGLLSSEKLTILGSPSSWVLDERHHTSRLQRDIESAFHPLLIYVPNNGQKSGAHKEHALAISLYMLPRPSRIATSPIQALFGIKGCRGIFFQKSALSNIPLAVLASVLRIPRILYIHEPLSVRQRILKGVPWRKAAIVTFFQVIEVLLMSRLFTGNQRNKLFFGRSLEFAPLLMPPTFEAPTDWSSRQDEILYFGRLDRLKYFETFQRLGLPKNIIATSNLNIENFDGPIEAITSEKKRALFFNHKFVWCVQRDFLTQSGVVIDALRFGCCSIIKKGDPIGDYLDPSAYLEISGEFSDAEVVDAIDAYSKKYPDGPVISEDFSNICGKNAFNIHWGPRIGVLSDDC